MRRVGYLYDWMLSEDNIRMAIRKAAKGHRGDPKVRKVLNDIDKYASRLRASLETGVFGLKPDKHFTRYEETSGKVREITSQAFFPNKVLDWLMTEALLAKGVVSAPLVDGCVGSIPNRGVSRGKRLVQRAYQKKGAKYVLQTDVRHFFQNIDTGMLHSMLGKKVKDRRFMALVGHLLSFGNGGTGKGLPLGYYSSQWLSNFYLSRFDRYVLEHHPAAYIRYVDDVVVFMANRRKAKALVRDMIEKAAEYGLEIKSTWRLFKRNDEPLDFLGFRFYDEDNIRMRKRNFYRLTRITKRLRAQMDERGKLCIPTCRIWISMYGWLTHIGCGKSYYLKRIKPIMSKGTILEAVGRHDSVLVRTGIDLHYC